MHERVLVVDDEPEICELVAVYLEAEGFVVECLHGGAAAVARVEDASAPAIDLAVLDVMLPGASGS
ncbi:response regulator [Olsenella profusa]|uniref:Response regulator n=1 Tax=Olsenella profusa TaxID=138595 RepID=A0ABS2F3D5_9ACTN|nr:response regulator [Olsenella profusa]MBM6775509.1 response regulator [Olsenella profusa]